MYLLRISTLAGVLAVSGLAQAAPINSASDPSLTGATVQDFESAPLGTYTSHSFGSLTVTALPSTYGTTDFSIATDYAGSYNTRGAQHISNEGSEFQALRLDFGSSVSAFGFLFGASDSTWILNAYSAGNTLLDTRSIPATTTSNAGDFFGLSGLAGATYATLTQVQDGIYSTGGVDYVFVDNVTYAGGSVAAVPEPGTYAMMLAGLAVVGGVVRRKKVA